MRLTNELRDTIIRSMIIQVTERDCKHIKRQEHLIGMAAYAKVYSKADRDAAAALPDGWVKTDGCLRFNIAGMDMRFNVDTPVPVKSAGSSYCHRLGDIADEKIKTKALALHGMKDDLRTRGAKIEAQAKSVLYSVSTYKQLEETWPEGKKFYSQFKPRKPEAALPAVRVASLNETLGIKAKAA